MKILGVDFETQNDDTQSTNITEVGALLVECVQTSVDIETAIITDSYHELDSLSSLVYAPTYPPQTEKIIEITGICDDMLKRDGADPKWALGKLNNLMQQADFIFAHNKRFDEVVYLSTCERLMLDPVRKPWICTLTEIDYAPKYRCKQLSHLAFDHDIVFDRSKLHRALDDVRLMMNLLAKYPLVDVLKYASEPWVYIQALFPAPFESKIGFEVGKAKAAKLNFGWEKAKGDDREFPKKWVKRVKERYVQKFRDEAEKLDLRIQHLPT